MLETLASATSLPNLHPALVHFPIALVFAAIAVEAVSLFLKRQVWLERAAALLCGLALAAAGAAYLAGRNAADSLGPIPAAAEAVLADHSDYALWTLVVIALAAALRVTSSAGDRRRTVSRFSVIRSVGVLFLLVAATLIACTADLGGSLVYQHGVAVATSEPRTTANPEPPGSADGSPSSDTARSLTVGQDGSLVWRPDSKDASPLGSILHPAEHSTLEAVGAGRQSSAESGFQIEVSGFAVLCFQEEFGDVVIEAVVDLSGFEGSVGLGHHIKSVEDGVYFTVDTSRQAVLTRRDNEDRKEFDRAMVDEQLTRVTLSTSVAGKHLKGRVNGQVVVHGHGSSGDAGQTGILVDGHGDIGIERIAVTPLSDR